MILRSVARGKTNKDIAAELGISEQGVKVHISRLLERYGAGNRVELVSLARAWPGADERGFAELAGDLAGIRADLDKTYQDATAFNRTRSGNGHAAASPPRAKTNGHGPIAADDLAAEVHALREVLGEINVALKLARELPADADVGPLVETIRTRVAAALEQSAKLGALVERERAHEGMSRQSGPR